MARPRAPGHPRSQLDGTPSQGAETDRNPVPPPATAPRFRRLLVGVDGTPASRQAVEWARAIAEGHEDPVHVCQVLPDITAVAGAEAGGWVASRQVLAAARQDAQAATDDARDRLERAGIETHVEVREGSPPKQLSELAREIDVDLLLLGSHGHGQLHRWLLGSVSDAARHLVDASVLVTKTSPPPKRILVATDGEIPANRAMAHGAILADRFGAELGVLHVLETPVYDLETSIDRIEEAYITGGPLARRPRPEVLVEIGEPADRIIEMAGRWKADLVVTGTREIHGLKALLEKSVSDAVAHDAPCSVLVVKDRLPR